MREPIIFFRYNTCFQTFRHSFLFKPIPFIFTSCLFHHLIQIQSCKVRIFDEHLMSDEVDRKNKLSYTRPVFFFLICTACLSSLLTSHTLWLHHHHLSWILDRTKFQINIYKMKKKCTLLHTVRYTIHVVSTSSYPFFMF